MKGDHCVAAVASDPSRRLPFVARHSIVSTPSVHLLPSFTGLRNQNDGVVTGFTRSLRVTRPTNEFYWVLLGFIGFYWVELGFE